MVDDCVFFLININIIFMGVNTRRYIIIAIFFFLILFQAFKWCSEVTLMRHEAGPIYVLFRDYGYLLGVALSCPLLERYVKPTMNTYIVVILHTYYFVYIFSYKNNNGSVYKRLPAILVLIVLNYTALQNTPKHLGRWIFLIYELGRNCIHSYTLLSIFPKIFKWDSSSNELTPIYNASGMWRIGLDGFLKCCIDELIFSFAVQDVHI